MDQVFATTKQLIKSIPDVSSGAFDDLNIAIRCIGTKPYDVICNCFVALPTMLGSSAMCVGSSIATDNLQSTYGIISNLANELLAVIFRNETILVFNNTEKCRAEIKTHITTLMKMNDPLLSVWTEIAMRGAVVPFICATLCNLPLMNVIPEDILDIKEAIHLDSSTTIYDFAPSTMPVEDKKKIIDILPHASRQLFKLMTYMSDAQLPMLKLCLVKSSSLITSPQKPLDFLQNHDIAQIVNICSDMLFSMCGNVYAIHELKGYVGYCMYLYYTKMFKLPKHDSNKITESIIFKHVKSRLEMGAVAQAAGPGQQ